jgi:hypothetical protein
MSPSESVKTLSASHCERADGYVLGQFDCDSGVIEQTLWGLGVDEHAKTDAKLHHPTMAERVLHMRSPMGQKYEVRNDRARSRQGA